MREAAMTALRRTETHVPVSYFVAPHPCCVKEVAERLPAVGYVELPNDHDSVRPDDMGFSFQSADLWGLAERHRVAGWMSRELQHVGQAVRGHGSLRLPSRVLSLNSIVRLYRTCT
jgi:hypothetical protein